MGENFDFIGISKLQLNYPAYCEGLDGECFDYSVYFNDGIISQERVDAVGNAIEDFDFKLVGDDYTGYLDVSGSENKVLVYLDLGNTKPQNEEKIIHGILLALNSIEGIEKVVVNEGCSDWEEPDFE